MTCTNTQLTQVRDLLFAIHRWQRKEISKGAIKYEATLTSAQMNELVVSLTHRDMNEADLIKLANRVVEVGTTEQLFHTCLGNTGESHD